MSIRNELLEKILLATETGTGFPVIVKDIQQPYVLENPPIGNIIDTGIDPTLYNGNSDIYFAIRVLLTGTGNTYALFEGVDSGMLALNPDIRVSRASEFEGVGGDANFAFWVDSTTGTIHYECDVDGAGKTITRASVTTIRLDIEAA